MAFAMVAGTPVTEVPQDLYIPPDALKVFLEAFEGPLDLLLYLIRRQNMDILAINVSAITEQYMGYIAAMQEARFELAAEYLLMAAMLAEIKSRSLLPRHEELEDDEEDPRANLIRRLQEYERFKNVSEKLEALPRMERELFQADAPLIDYEAQKPPPVVDFRELLMAFSEVMRRADLFESHQVQREKLSTRERMTQILAQLKGDQFQPFESLFTRDEGKLGVVVSFLAILELVKESLLDLVQNEAFGPIHVRARVQ